MYYLYIIYVGGKLNNCNIEVHDIIFAIGKKIEDTYEQIKRAWCGKKESLHIDSYTKLEFVDGYKIIIKELVKKKSELIKEKNLYLWFIYLGGYEHNRLEEYHNILFVIADSKINAKKKAINKNKKNLNMIHIDNIIKYSR